MISLFIRADADPSIGSGHIMRSIALSQACLKRGGEVFFISRCESETLRRRIVEEGCHLVYIDKSYPDPKDLEKTLSVLQGGTKPDQRSWVVMDGYHFDSDYQRAIRDSGVKILIIDDYNHLPTYAGDIILNQNIKAKNLHYSVESDTVTLLGTPFVLLRDEYLTAEPRDRDAGAEAQRVLVTLGGADSANVTLKVVRALSQLKTPKLNATIVLGPVNLNRKIIQSELENCAFEHQLLCNVKNMSSLMRWADLAVSAGGSSCWELAYMGVPFLVIVLSKNQEGIARGLETEGVATNCGWFDELSVTKLLKLLEDIMIDRRRMESYSRKGRQLVDGFGRERVLNFMEGV